MSKKVTAEKERITQTEMCERIAENLKLAPPSVVEEMAKMIFEDSNVKYHSSDQVFEIDSPEEF